MGQVLKKARKEGRILSKEFIKRYPDYPEHMNKLGKFVYLRTYSRYLPEKGRRENWRETCERSVRYNVELLVKFLKKKKMKIDWDWVHQEAEFLFDNQFNLRQSLSGRTMWVGGADTGVADKFPLANFNCSFTNLEESEDLVELFYLLLVGTGVGGKVLKEIVAKFPKMNTKIEIEHKEYAPIPKGSRLEDSQMVVNSETGLAVITIGDSKEGWVHALRLFLEVLTRDIYRGVKSIQFIYDNVRPQGEPLVTFGGTASGPQPLKEMFQGFHNVLNNAIDPYLEPIETDEDGYGQLRPIHLVDMANLIGYNVVVGGVRRTAEIMLGSDDDWEFIFAKYGINGLWGDDAFEKHERIRQEMIKLDIPVPKFFDDLAVKYYYVYDLEDNRAAARGELPWTDRKKLAEFTSPEEATAYALELGYKPEIRGKDEEGNEVIVQYAEYYPFPCNEKRPLHHRRMSNNSVAFIHKPKREFLHLLFMIMESLGEPGFINLRAAAIRRLKGRGILKPTEEQIITEALDIGLNPCAEILLSTKGVCNLTTVNAVAFVKYNQYGVAYLDEEAFVEAQKASARAGLRMTLVQLELENWDAVQQRDGLLGTSLTGWKDAMAMVDYTVEQEERLIKILGAAARDEANRVADLIGVNRPLLVTTVKPEGTISQVFGGVSSGLHMSHSPYYIRRIRINAADPLAKAVLAHKGWVVNPETGTPGKTRAEKMQNARTLVIDFPIASGATRTKDDVLVDEQFDTYFMFQDHYTEHNSSNTIHVHDGQWERAEERVWERFEDFVGVSFLRHDGGSYELAPYEAISEERYNKLATDMQDFDSGILAMFETPAESELGDDADCSTGACPIR